MLARDDDQAADVSASWDPTPATPSGLMAALIPDLVAFTDKNRRLCFTGAGWQTGPLNPNVTLNGFPAMTFFGETLYLAHQAGGTDHRLWYMTSSDGSNWSSDTLIPNITLNGSPAMLQFGRKLYLAHQAGGADHRLWYITSTDGIHWSSDTLVPNVQLNASPAMAEFQEKLYLAHQGSDLTQAATSLWYTTFDGTNWSPDTPIPNVTLSGSPSMVTFGEKLWVAYQPVNGTGNDVISCVTYDGKTWSKPFSIGDSHTPIHKSSSPSLYTLVPEKLQVVYYDFNGTYRWDPVPW